jgi:hypothetical protein
LEKAEMLSQNVVTEIFGALRRLEYNILSASDEVNQVRSRTSKNELLLGRG